MPFSSVLNGIFIGGIATNKVGFERGECRV